MHNMDYLTVGELLDEYLAGCIRLDISGGAVFFITFISWHVSAFVVIPATGPFAIKTDYLLE